MMAKIKSVCASGKYSSFCTELPSLMAFGRGEMWGQGLGNSVQKLEYLPEAHTDFIFAIIRGQRPSATGSADSRCRTGLPTGSRRRSRGEYGTVLGNSVQKLEYLPEAHTDFIFAIIGEELGYIGVVLGRGSRRSDDRSPALFGQSTWRGKRRRIPLKAPVPHRWRDVGAGTRQLGAKTGVFAGSAH
jgi:hypothetical protein